ncbi:MAG TPA: TIGR01777 family oxidoreductase, partial [Acidimicrobiales bacterium]|nr:TIGR01777 family oxidoreductase [Acidimicrobiales bacterium]
MKFRSRIPAPVGEVFAWHERPGAITRLSPPWVPVRVVKESTSLRDGEAVFGLPGGVHFTSRHDPSGYEAGVRFVDTMPGWRHTHGFLPDGDDATVIEDHLQTAVPEALVRAMFAYRHRQLAADLAAQARWGGPKVTVAMTGSSGLVGTALRALLTTAGHEVVRLVRRAPAAPDERQWAPSQPDPKALDGTDVVVHLAGAPILGRFTTAHKQRLVSSRVAPTRLLAAAAGERPFISASAIGYYGPQALGDGPKEKGTGFLADLVAEWEETGAKGRAVQVRTGIALSPLGGLLGLTYPVFLAGLGGRIGDGQQWMSWIALDDLVDIYFRAIFDEGLRGPVDAVAPVPVTNQTFTRTLAHVLHRPSLLSVPIEVTRLLLGEGSTEFVEASQKIEPLAGHTFRYPELEPALRHMLGRA